MLHRSILLILFGLLTAPLSALTITLVDETDWDVASQPPKDYGVNGGAKLMAIAQAAANHWSDIIEDAHNIETIIRYDNGIIPSDIVLTANRSTNLQNWTPANVMLEDTDFDPIDCVEIRHYRSTFPLGSLPKEFLRLEAKYFDR